MLQGYPSEPKILSSLINQQQTKTINIRIKTHNFVILRPCRNLSKQINQTGKLLPDSANQAESIDTCHYSTDLMIGQLETINSLTARVFAWKRVNFQTKQENNTNDNSLTNFNSDRLIKSAIFQTDKNMFSAK